MNEALFSILKRLNSANDIALYCHTNPDCDALGSMLALYHALKSKGKNVCAYCDTPIAKRYLYLNGADKITFPQKRVHELALCVDTGDLDRLGQCMRSFLASRTQIAIDHHKTFAKFANINYVDASVSSCSEIVYQLLNMGKMLNKDVAELLFAGIVTDSACFSLSSVSASTFETATHLLKFGIDSGDIIYNMFTSTSEERFKLKARVLSKAKFYCNAQIGILTFSHEDFDATNTTTDDSEGIVNELLAVSSIKIAFSLSQVSPHSFKVSIRTKGDIDASEIAMIFGGGGHKNASGCRLNGFYEDIIERLLKISKDAINWQEY